MRSRSAIRAQSFVIHVLKNARSIGRWNITNCVHRHVEIALMNVVKWLDNQENIGIELMTPTQESQIKSSMIDLVQDASPS
jgi:hypothetical protein